MNLSPGTQLGPYKILALLGTGGMGEVWRATDSRLGRSVAIKILPPGFAHNEQFRARFEREAKTISSLNHPNICTLFDIGHEGGAHFLVLELIEGETLSDRLQKGALPPDQTLKFGAQIADALDRAHKQGIIHRDLKPGNVMLAKTGAKLLDFGLARSGVESSPIQGLTELATQAKPLTQEGTILGTFQYMAPEQLEGLEADARTDIFALGALLYEMATGKRAFEAKSRTSLIAAIVSSHPVPISQVTQMTPPGLDHVVRKCLEKDPDDRWQSARDVASELRWISESGSSAAVAATATTPRSKARKWLAWALAGVTTAVAIAASGALVARREPPRHLIESSIVTPANMRTLLNGGITISPDGKTVAFALNDLRGGNSLWVRAMDSPSFRQLAGTDGATHPFWSPNSRRIGFFAGGKVKTIDVMGGATNVVCDAPAGRGASWNSDGTILLTPSVIGGLMAVKASGGAPEPLTQLRPGDTSHRWAFFLPDDRTFLFLALNESSASTAICQSSLDRPGEIKQVVNTSSSAAYVPGGYLLFARDNLVLAQRYDSKRAATIGETITLTDRVALTDRFYALFSVANDRTLLLQRGSGFTLSELVWVDRSGKLEGLVAEAGLYFSPSLSQDGSRLVVDVSNTTDGQGDIWIFDLVRGVSTRLTYDKTNESSPQWFAGDKRIVFYTGKASTGNIYDVPSGGTGEAQLLVDDEREKRPTDVSSDGAWIVFNSSGGPTGSSSDIWVWSVAEKKAKPWLATPFTEECGFFSPDSKWLAYQSDESGRTEIYVRAFPDSDQKWMISKDGGIMPVWSSDGKEIFYVSPDGHMMTVAVTTGASFETSPPVALFDAAVRTRQTPQYDVSSDGRHFLLNRLSDSAPPEPVTMLQNWDVMFPEK